MLPVIIKTTPNQPHQPMVPIIASTTNNTPTATRTFISTLPKILFILHLIVDQTVFTINEKHNNCLARCIYSLKKRYCMLRYNTGYTHLPYYFHYPMELLCLGALLPLCYVLLYY